MYVQSESANFLVPPAELTSGQDMSDVQDDYSELASKLKALDGILIKYNGEQPGNENLKERLEAIAACVIPDDCVYWIESNFMSPDTALSNNLQRRSKQS